MFVEKSTLKQRFNYMVLEFLWQHQKGESHLCFNECFEGEKQVLKLSTQQVLGREM